MRKKKYKELNNVQCPDCKYCNHIEFLKYSGVCHLCGKVLDERAYFKQQMNKKLRLWRKEKMDRW